MTIWNIFCWFVLNLTQMTEFCTTARFGTNDWCQIIAHVTRLRAIWLSCISTLIMMGRTEIICALGCGIEVCLLNIQIDIVTQVCPFRFIRRFLYSIIEPFFPCCFLVKYSFSCNLQLSYLGAKKEYWLINDSSSTAGTHSSRYEWHIILNGSES